jgi:hypothetical protein
MDISRQFINNPIRVWLTILLLGIGGIFALLNIGRLEDPAFTIKTAVVITHYPAPRRSRLRKKSPCRWRTRCNSCPIWTTSAQFPPMVCRKSPSISPRIITPASCRKSGMSCAVG